MTPYDILKDWESRIWYIAPEEKEILLTRTRAAIKKVEEIFDHGPNTEAGAEAIEVIQKLRKFEVHVMLGKNQRDIEQE